MKHELNEFLKEHNISEEELWETLTDSETLDYMNFASESVERGYVNAENQQSSHTYPEMAYLVKCPNGGYGMEEVYLVIAEKYDEIDEAYLFDNKEEAMKCLIEYDSDLLPSIDKIMEDFIDKAPDGFSIEENQLAVQRNGDFVDFKIYYQNMIVMDNVRLCDLDDDLIAELDGIKEALNTKINGYTIESIQKHRSNFTRYYTVILSKGSEKYEYDLELDGYSDGQAQGQKRNMVELILEKIVSAMINEK